MREALESRNGCRGSYSACVTAYSYSYTLKGERAATPRQCEIFKDFKWKITCNGIHNIFITDNFPSMTSKGATLHSSHPDSR